MRAHVANRHRPGMYAEYTYNPPRESPLVAWMLGGVRVATAVGATALLLHVAGHVARIASSRLVLHRLGADPALGRKVVATEAFASVAIAGLVAVAIGLASAWLYEQMTPLAAMPVTAVVLVTAGVLAAGVLGSLAALLASTDIPDQPS